MIGERGGPRPPLAATTARNRFRALLGQERASPLIVAHRGDSAHAPENTLEAARLGREAGADAWELDVQLTRDGVPIVIHDESLLRTTDVALRFAADPRGSAGYRVSDFDLTEVQDLDAGSWFLALDGARTASRFGTLDALDPRIRDACASGAVRIPTLAEAMTLTAQLDWQVNVELKSFPNTSPRLLAAVLAVIDATETSARVLLSSFDHADVARAATLRPEIATGVLAATPLYRPHEYVRDGVGADTYHPSSLVLGEASDAYRAQPSPAKLRVEDLALLRAAGVPVLVYTVNDSSRGGLAAHLVEAGVNGFFTDNPGPLCRLLTEQGLPAWRGPTS